MPSRRWRCSCHLVSYIHQTGAVRSHGTLGRTIVPKKVSGKHQKSRCTHRWPRLWPSGRPRGNIQTPQRLFNTKAARSFLYSIASENQTFALLGTGQSVRGRALWCRSRLQVVRTDLPGAAYRRLDCYYRTPKCLYYRPAALQAALSATWAWRGVSCDLHFERVSQQR